MLLRYANTSRQFKLGDIIPCDIQDFFAISSSSIQMQVHLPM